MPRPGCPLSLGRRRRRGCVLHRLRQGLCPAMLHNSKASQSRKTPGLAASAYADHLVRGRRPLGEGLPVSGLKILHSQRSAAAGFEKPGKVLQQHSGDVPSLECPAPSAQKVCSRHVTVRTCCSRRASLASLRVRRTAFFFWGDPTSTMARCVSALPKSPLDCSCTLSVALFCWCLCSAWFGLIEIRPAQRGFLGELHVVLSCQEPAKLRPVRTQKHKRPVRAADSVVGFQGPASPAQTQYCPRFDGQRHVAL